MKRVVQIVHNEDCALLKFARLTVLVYPEPSDSFTESSLRTTQGTDQIGHLIVVYLDKDTSQF